MTGHRINLKGFRLDRHGKLVRDVRRLSVSERLKLQSKNSKRVRVVRKTAAT